MHNSVTVTIHGYLTLCITVLTCPWWSRYAPWVAEVRTISDGDPGLPKSVLSTYITVDLLLWIRSQPGTISSIAQRALESYRDRVESGRDIPR